MGKHWRSTRLFEKVGTPFWYVVTETYKQMSVRQFHWYDSVQETCSYVSSTVTLPKLLTSHVYVPYLSLLLFPVTNFPSIVKVEV